MNTPTLRRLFVPAWLTLALAAMVPPVSADDTAPKEKAPKIKKADTDKDGVVSEAEKAAAKAERGKKKAEFDAKMLERYDANKNGVLDPDEKAKMLADRKAARDKEKAEKEAHKAEKAEHKAAKEKDADKPK